MLYKCDLFLTQLYFCKKNELNGNFILMRSYIDQTAVSLSVTVQLLLD